MSIKRRTESTEKEFADIPNLAEGEHEGRLRYVADLGVHTNEYKGEIKPDVQKLALGIEIVGETVEIEGEVKPRLLWTNAFNIFNTMTEKGKELQLFKVFCTTAVDGVEADWDSVINEPCNVLVVHKNGKGDNKDKVYDNIGSISSVPSKYKDGVEKGLIEDGCTGDVDDEENPAQKATFGLTTWLIANRISGQSEEPANLVVPDHTEDYDDDIPF